MIISGVNVFHNVFSFAHRVKATVDSMVVLGCKQKEGMATIVKSLLEEDDKSKTAEDNLLNVQFEQHPLDKECDSRVHVNARPLEIVYDAVGTFMLISCFFSSKCFMYSGLF